MNTTIRMILVIALLALAIWAWFAGGFFFQTVALFCVYQALSWTFPKKAAQILRWQATKWQEFKDFYFRHQSA